MKGFNSLVAIVFIAASAITAPAEEAVFDLNIPPQPVQAALDALAKQSGVQPFYADASSVQGLKSPGVVGRYDLRAAVEKLLAGTGLTYNFTGVKTVAIKRPERVAANEAPDAKKAKEDSKETTVLPEMTVTGSPIDDTSYNPPNATTATKTDTPIMETPCRSRSCRSRC